MPKGTRFLPDHIPGTGRAWKSRKRKELRAVRRAIEKLRLGCAFAPCYDRENDISYWERMDSAVTELQARFSVKQWGR